MTSPGSSVTGEQIERLISAQDRNTNASIELATATTEYQERARLARFRFRATIVAVTVVAVAILAGIMVLFLRINDSLGASKDARSTILDCVQPTGKCAQRSDRQLASVIAGLEHNSVLSAVCAARYTHLPVDKAILATQRCVRTHTSPTIGGATGNNGSGGSPTPGAEPPARPPPSSAPSTARPSTASRQRGGRPTKSHKPPSPPPPSPSGGGFCIPVALPTLIPLPLPSLPVLC